MQLIVDDLLTRYEKFGDKNKPVLLILHGWNRSLEEWTFLSKELTSKYYVLLLDLPGFGGSAMPNSTYSIYDYADFVQNFLSKLKINKCSLLGHSFGGRIGVILAAKNNNIEELVLVDSGGTEVTPFYYKAFLSIAKPLSKAFPKKLVKHVKKILGSTDYLSAGSMKDIFKKVVNEDLTYLLNKIKTKTLIIWGSEDKELSLEHSKIFRDKIPNNKIKIFWGAGHDPHLERRQEFVEEIREFLNV